jgi:uncharacterized protein (DUF486 family)
MKDSNRVAETARKITTLKSMMSMVGSSGQPYFSIDYLKKALQLNFNEMRMMKIGKIFYDE